MVALVSGISPVNPTGSSCLLCSACRFLLIKPKQTECGHRYCTACLENLFKTQNEADCYVCQQKVLRSKVYHDRAAENDAYATKIQCTAYREGCDWTGTLRNYLRTHRAQCDFHVVPCSNVTFGCEAIGPRKKMAAHETQECEWRMELCPQCETFCIHKLLEDHITSCAKQKEDCPACGQANLTKMDLEKHRNPQHGTCPDVQVSCPFKEIGCLEKLRRRDLDEHLRAAQQTHLLQMLSLASGLRGRELAAGGETETETAGTQGRPAAAAAAKTDGLERSVRGLRQELDECGQAIEALQQKCRHYERVILGLQGEQEVPGGRPSLAAGSTGGVLVWKVTQFASRLLAAKSERRLSFYSPAFASHPFGYQLCCRMYPNGDGSGKGTHVSLFLAVVRGEYDGVLPWPFKQKVTFLLLDQAQQRHVRESFSPDVLSSSFQRPRSHMNVASGCPTFARHDLLLRPHSPYLKNDTLYIKVLIDPAGLPQ
ncbi:TNF receptor-associated factor 2-like [Carcharodon carcharias]|uniref:TNF receptor-associated factor 2-like n=1 Tax=Carcharodon carcharias TaxID=13397 RepID=UPI001B7DAF3A|nr:TNF receptor-associated factor 2-like [Carcharodon carcharias]